MQTHTKKPTFGELVAYKVEQDTKRWRYWDALYTKHYATPSKKVKFLTGWSKERIVEEKLLAEQDLFEA